MNTRKQTQPTFTAIRTLIIVFQILGASCAIFAQQTSPQNPNEVLDEAKAKTDLYRADADARVEISEALKKAVAEKKRVILIFGGNWCYDCHVLDQALHEGAAGRIVKQSYLLVHVDIGEANKNLDLVEKYKSTLAKGVPTVVLLDRTGRVIYSSTEGEFEAARKMMKKDLVAFLNHWKEVGVR